MKAKNLYQLFIPVLMMLVPSLYAQDEASETEILEPLYVDMAFNYLKKSDDSYQLKAGLNAVQGSEYVAAEGLPVNFYFITDTVPELLGTVETDAEGNAILVVPAGTQLFRNEEGYITFTAEFEGNEQYDYASGEFIVKDVKIDMQLEIIDSVKTISISAYWINGMGEEVPITEEDIFIYVKGLFSKLQIADGWLEDGTCTIELTKPVPGDYQGMITLIAGYIEHSDYGNVEKTSVIDWGVIPAYVTEDEGELWTSIAPTWMIVLLVILLAGVWSHYIFAMVQLVRIKRMSASGNKEN